MHISCSLALVLTLRDIFSKQNHHNNNYASSLHTHNWSQAKNFEQDSFDSGSGSSFGFSQNIAFTLAHVLCIIKHCHVTSMFRAPSSLYVLKPKLKFYGHESGISKFVFYLHLSTATGSLLCGLLQIVYCSLWYSSGVGIWNAAILAAVGIIGLCYGKVGTRFLVCSHLILLVVGLSIVALSSVALHCTTGRCQRRFRAHYKHEQCLQRLHSKVSASLFYSTQETVYLNITILSLTIFIALIQICSSSYVIWRKFFKFFMAIKNFLNIFFCISLFALLGIAAGSAHIVYCGHFFYTGAGIYCPFVVFLVSIYGNTIKDLFGKGVRIRLMALLCFAATSSIGLATVGVLAIHCDNNSSFSSDVPLFSPVSNVSSWNILSYIPPLCHPPAYSPNIYGQCYERLEFMGYWNREEDPRLYELKKDQMVIYAMLVIIGLLTVLLCIIAFRRELRKFCGGSTSGLAHIMKQAVIV